MAELKLFDNPTEKKPHTAGVGIRRTYDFPNGYSASVVRFKTMLGSYASYTDNENEWELAVMKNGELCYDTPITDDVIGHLLAPDVEKLLERIRDLEAVDE